MIVGRGDRRLAPRPADRSTSTCSRRRPPGTSSRRWRSRRSRSPASRRPPTWRPTWSGSRGTCAAWSARRAVLLPLIYAGIAAIALMAVPVVAGPDGPQTALGEHVHRGAGARGGEELRPGLALDRAAGGRGGDRARGAGLGGEHLDARAVAARLRAGHQPPGPELAGQARHALHSVRRDLGARR